MKSLTATEVGWLHAAKMLSEQLCAIVHATPSCGNENFQAKSKLKLNKLIDKFSYKTQIFLQSNLSIICATKHIDLVYVTSST